MYFQFIKKFFILIFLQQLPQMPFFYIKYRIFWLFLKIIYPNTKEVCGLVIQIGYPYSCV